MRIYKMTATFGKLEHQTLTLEPGLNIITAPNEWGKSTWCAFLVAMLYGLDTRAKTTKTTLADKERYAPWSGAPMEGRIDLNWNGRDITIERRSKRRVPLGEFKAYETESGLNVPELTAANCGSVLLGVEQSVFRRAGFIRHADLPVTQDEALRRRLNSLVTTGDENGAADRLAEKLKELKNRCRYNRSGLLPQAEAERDELEGKIAELESLENQCRNLKLRLEEVREWIAQLTNHRQALEYEAVQENARRVAQARDALESAEAELRTLEAVCADLPGREEAERKRIELRSFREQWSAIREEQEALPLTPVKPRAPEPFAELTPDEARNTAAADAQAYSALKQSAPHKMLLITALFGAAATGVLVYLQAYLYAAVAGAGAVAALVWGIWELYSRRQKMTRLEEKYGSWDSDLWVEEAEAYEAALVQYREDLKAYQESSSDVEVRMMVLRNRRQALCGSQDPEAVLNHWIRVTEAWNACDTARKEAQRARNHFDTLNALVRPVDQPSRPDTLTYSGADTARLLGDGMQEQQRLQNRLGQYQGRMETLGNRKQLQELLEKKNARIAKLEQTYEALVIAQETLSQARGELQRRFAPRITKQAQTFLAEMTDGRYQTMTMGEDLSLHARTGDEDTLHEAIWRSDGTMDQLYLALRLAVAEELTPNAPLILDDALVRFDDKRMESAVNILRQIAKTRQVILFTCQGRENQVK